jgi:hypothetical protein
MLGERWTRVARRKVKSAALVVVRKYRRKTWVCALHQVPDLVSMNIPSAVRAGPND